MSIDKIIMAARIIVVSFIPLPWDLEFLFPFPVPFILFHLIFGIYLFICAEAGEKCNGNLALSSSFCFQRSGQLLCTQQSTSYANMPLS